MRRLSRIACYHASIQASNYRIWPILLFATIAILLSLLAFGQSLSFGFAPIDDYNLITHNLAVRILSWESLRSVFTHFDPELYIPLTFVSFQLNVALTGMNPWFFHATNLGLHIANTLLVVWLVNIFVRSGKRLAISDKHEGQALTASRLSLAALVASLLWSIHPIHTEAIVWISARKDLLSAFFALLTVLSMMRANGQWKNLWWLCALLFFTCSLLSKISAVGLPLLIILFLLQKGRTLRQSLRAAAPFLLVSIILGGVALFGKGDVIGVGSLLHRMFFGAYAIGISFLHFFLPFHLQPFYPLPPFNFKAVLIALIPLIMIMIMIMITRRLLRRSPLAAFGLLWFFVFILPTIANIQTDAHAAAATFAADRYLYLPSIGLIITTTALLDEFLEKHSQKIGAGLLACLVTILLLFTILSRGQTSTWGSPDTLFSHALAVTPESVPARVALSRVLSQQSRLQEAFAVLREGLKYRDDPELHLEAGFVYAKARDISEAEAQFTIVRERDPLRAEPFYGLAGIRAYQNRPMEAEALYKEAIKHEPRYSAAHIALAEILLEKGDVTGAKEELREGLQSDPNNAEALRALAKILRSEGHIAEAEHDEREAAILEAPL